MAKRRKEMTMIVTMTFNAETSAAQARRELKQRANHTGFEFWDAGIKVKSIKPAPRGQS